MIAPSKRIVVLPRPRPIRVQGQEPRMWFSPRAEAQRHLSLSQFAADCLPVDPLSRGSVWHCSGEAA